MHDRGLHDRSFCWRATDDRAPCLGASDHRRAARARGVWLLGFIALATGCAPSIGSAVRAYEHGRYPEALEELIAEERSVIRHGGVEATRYALYRGLSHWALGDLRATHFWFERVECAIATDPALLSPDETARLAAARAHLPR